MAAVADSDDIEPILMDEEEDNERFLIFPPDPQYEDLWELYIVHRNAFWQPEEIPYTADLVDWNTKLTKDERYFIEMILAFFAGSDGIVLENLVLNFASEVKVPSARAFYACQANIEIIHAHAYALHLDTLLQNNEVRKQELFHAIDTIPVVADKANWSKKWMVDDPFQLRLIAFAIVEGVFFSGSFCSIFWLRDRKLMIDGMGASNELIARDEGLHVIFAVTLFKHCKYRPPESQVHTMMKEAVDIEKKFILAILPQNLDGMNAELMCTYIEFVADRLLVQLGYTRVYESKNPFPFMDRISLNRVTNFFENRVTEYKKADSSNIDESAFKGNTLDF